MTKRNRIIYWISTVWLALGMLSTGAVQLFRLKADVDQITQLGYPVYLLTILARCLENLGSNLNFLY